MAIPPGGAALYASGSDRQLYDHYRDLGLTDAQARQHVELRRANRSAPSDVVPSPDLGMLGAARIGAGQGLGGAAGAIGAGTLAGMAFGPPGAIIGGLIGGLGGGAAVKPLTELLSSAPASDVAEQWDATVSAHPTARLAGEIAGGLAGGSIAGKVAKIGGAIRTASDNAAIRQARRAVWEARAAAARAPAGAPTTQTLEEQVAKQYGVPVEQIQGKLNAPVSTAPVYTPPAGESLIPTGPKSFAVEGVRATPKPPVRPAGGTLEDWQALTRRLEGARVQSTQGARPGHPIWYGPETITRSPEVRASLHELGGAEQVTEILRTTPYAQLRSILDGEVATPGIRAAVLRELQRRGIMGEGLLPPR